MKRFLEVLIPIVIVSSLWSQEAKADERPNVLFIAIDDLNDWIGCLNGHPQAHTPNIDRLAKRGILFTNAHCASPACNPSRAAIFSGKMAWKTGVWSNESKKLFQQHPDIQVLPRAFKDAGYVTLGTGKLMHSSGAANRQMLDQHFNPEQRWSPFTRASVRYTKKEQPTKGTDHPRHIVTRKDADPVVLPLNGMPSDRNPQNAEGESFDWGPLDVPDSAMGDTQITDWAIEKLQADFKKPFFLGVGYYRPHIPLWAPQKYFERFQNQKVQLPPIRENDLDDLSPTGKRWAIEAVTAGLHATVVKHGEWEEAVKGYLACTTFVDAQIGRLLKALDEGQYGDNTLIVLWTDHGWHLGEKQHWGKWTGWERSTRVPLIFVPTIQAGKRSPNRGHSTCAAPVSLIDLYPTLTELCKVKAPNDLDGQSLVPLLRNVNLQTDRVVVTSFDRGNVSLRSDQWRYLRYRDGSVELYNIKLDPNEWTNLANDGQHNSVLERFRKKIPEAALVRGS
ncbi:MAG: sulfatase [Planctomycetaceae bacterium]|nr:sulfatase [Planctomycetaceae bacterium]